MRFGYQWRQAVMTDQLVLHDAHVQRRERAMFMLGRHIAALRINDTRNVVGSLRFADEQTVVDTTGLSFEALLFELMETVVLKPRRGDGIDIGQAEPAIEQRGNARIHQNITSLHRIMEALPFVVGVTDRLHMAWLRRYVVHDVYRELQTCSTESLTMPPTSQRVRTNRNDVRFIAPSDPQWRASDNRDSVQPALMRLRDSVGTRFVDPMEFVPMRPVIEFDNAGIQRLLTLAISAITSLINCNVFKDSPHNDVTQLRRFETLLNTSLNNAIQYEIERHNDGGRDDRRYERERLAIGLGLLFKLLTGNELSANNPSTNQYLKCMARLLAHIEGVAVSEKTLRRLAGVAVTFVNDPTAEPLCGRACWLSKYRLIRRQLLAAHLKASSSSPPTLVD